MMNLDRSEKLIKYVADMHDRTGEYDINPSRIHSEIEGDEEMEEIYKGIDGERICKICEKLRLFDEENQEFYCPLHG